MQESRPANMYKGPPKKIRLCLAVATFSLFLPLVLFVQLFFITFAFGIVMLPVCAILFKAVFTWDNQDVGEAAELALFLFTNVIYTWGKGWINYYKTGKLEFDNE